MAAHHRSIAALAAAGAAGVLGAVAAHRRSTRDTSSRPAGISPPAPTVAQGSSVNVRMIPSGDGWALLVSVAGSEPLAFALPTDDTAAAAASAAACAYILAGAPSVDGDLPAISYVDADGCFKLELACGRCGGCRVRLPVADRSQVQAARYLAAQVTADLAATDGEFCPGCVTAQRSCAPPRRAVDEPAWYDVSREEWVVWRQGAGPGREVAGLGIREFLVGSGELEAARRAALAV